MEKLHSLQEKAANISLPKPETTSFFCIEGNDSGMSKSGVLDALLRKLLNITNYSRILVSSYGSSNILIKKDLILKRCPNLKKFESVPIRNDYPRLESSLQRDLFVDS